MNKQCVHVAFPGLVRQELLHRFRIVVAIAFLLLVPFVVVFSIASVLGRLIVRHVEVLVWRVTLGALVVVLFKYIRDPRYIVPPESLDRTFI